MSRALVTGAEGFLGRHFTAELRLRGWAVDGYDIASGVDVLREVFTCRNPKRSGLGAGGPAAGPYDLVVHAAAWAPHRAAIDAKPATHLYNRMLDAALFDWAVRTGQGRVLYLSSCAALDAAPDAYGRVKLAGEEMAGQARAAGLPVSVVRPFSGYGEDQSTNFPFGAFAARARQRADPFPLWNPDAVRDWIHVDDVVAGALAVAESATTEAVQLCTGIGTSCASLARMMTDAAGYHPWFEPQPDRPAGAPRRVGDPTHLLELYPPRVSLADGVKRAMAGGGR